ncbi:MAG TPA: ribosome maturation factor RimM [Candidatus Polarisedimenticolia bacterium]|nr:ribosome maturation factor RimM [Candidatus Polarisedimenticolia bacterium]
MKSSNSDRQEEIRGVRSEIDRPVLVATRLTLRGAGGRLTATLVPEGIDQLKDRSWVLIGGGAGPRRRYEIEEYSSYARKVVLKLKGVESAREAEALVGQDIFLPCNGLVDLPAGTYYIFQLIGLRVFTREGREIGTVRDVLSTGAAPLLAIDPAPIGGGGAREEILLPAARSICETIDLASRRIVIDPPEGLLELYGI